MNTLPDVLQDIIKEYNYPSRDQIIRQKQRIIKQIHTLRVVCTSSKSLPPSLSDTKKITTMIKYTTKYNNLGVYHHITLRKYM
jgi:hypothetical protein